MTSGSLGGSLLVAVTWSEPGAIPDKASARAHHGDLPHLVVGRPEDAVGGRQAEDVGLGTVDPDGDLSRPSSLPAASVAK